MQRRYFLETAKAINYSTDIAEAILDEMLGKIERVIEDVAVKLPQRFPGNISQPIFDGLRLASQKLKG